MQNTESVLRLRKRHEPGKSADVDVPALYAEQSIRGAIGGAAGAAVILTVMWVYATVVSGQFFPWFSVIEGILIGRAVRHFGNGIVWHFPAVAAAVAVCAAYVGSFFAALLNASLGSSALALRLVTEIRWHTIVTFTTDTFGAVGMVYAISGAIVAAFFAGRRLTRNEAVALRRYKEAKV